MTIAPAQDLSANPAESTTAPAAGPGGDQGPPAGDLVDRRLPRHRHADPDRGGAPHRAARRPVRRSASSTWRRQRQRGDRGRAAWLRGGRHRLRAALLERARRAVEGRGALDRLRRGRRGGADVPRRQLRRRHVRLRRDVRARPGPDRRRAPPGRPVRRPDRASWPIRPMASSASCSGRSRSTSRRRPGSAPRSSGHGGPSPGAVRREAEQHPDREADVRLPRPVAGGMGRDLAARVRPDPEGLRRRSGGSTGGSRWSRTSSSSSAGSTGPPMGHGRPVGVSGGGDRQALTFVASTPGGGPDPAASAPGTGRPSLASTGACACRRRGCPPWASRQRSS